MSAEKPHRVQLSRKKGWRMPPNTVSVARPTKWGNPFIIGDGTSTFHCTTVQECVDAYRSILTGATPAFLARDLPDLRGKNLACWCPLYDENGNRVSCHADVLLELANQ